jgi:hypothetical protein
MEGWMATADLGLGARSDGGIAETSQRFASGQGTSIFVRFDTLFDRSAARGTWTLAGNREVYA